MQQIVNFLIRYKNTLLFLLLLFLAIFFTVQSHSYHKSKFINSANFLTGGVYNWVKDIDEYFNLKEYNNRLVEENKYLRSRLGELNAKNLDTIYQDTSSFDNPYQFTSAKVIRNTPQHSNTESPPKKNTTLLDNTRVLNFNRTITKVLSVQLL